MTDKKNVLSKEEMDNVAGGGSSPIENFIDDVMNEATKEPDKKPAGDPEFSGGIIKMPEIDLNSPTMRPGGIPREKFDLDVLR